MPDTPWDITIPGLFYEKVKNTFPQREQRLIQEVVLTQDPKGLQQQIRTSERIMLFTQDRKTLIQVGPRLLAVSVLKPYPTWQYFKLKIEMAWKSLQDILEVKGLQRIGLRYINQIELAAKSIELKEYFEFYPFIGPHLPQDMVTFIVGGEFSYAEGRDRCRVQLIPIPSEGKLTFMLDIDYFVAHPRAVEASNALNWTEEAHSQIVEIFECCISDRLREMFEEVK